MRLARYWHDGRPRPAVVLGEKVVDLEALVPERWAEPNPLWPLLAENRAQIEAALACEPTGRPLASVQLAAPITEPRKFIAVGLNYLDHALEMGVPPPQRPRLFVKLAGALTGPYDGVAAPEFSDTLDYEGELAFVIGRRCRSVPRSSARDVVAGFLVLNDLSVREYVNPDLLILGKGCHGFAPCGPWITSSDEIEDPQALALRTWVNGELRQNSNSSGMICGCWELVELITRAVTLEPGDLITTGSPPGSGGGRRPPRYLRPDDVVRVEISGLGALENRIVRETDP